MLLPRPIVRLLVLAVAAGCVIDGSAAAEAPPAGPYLKLPLGRSPQGGIQSWNLRMNAGGAAYVKSKTPGGVWPAYDDETSAARHGLCGGAAGMNPSFLQPEEPKTTVRAGEVSTFEVVLRDNIGGHFEFRICDGTNVSQSCFNGHVLQRAEAKNLIASDDLFDPTYPERFYVPAQAGTYSMRYIIPTTLNCTHCVLQWYFFRLSNCIAPGYYDLNFPAKYRFNTNLPLCTTAGQYPEEYWSCADVTKLPPLPGKGCTVVDGEDCKRLVGYVTSWAHYRPSPWNFEMQDIDSSQFTHLILSFAGIDSSNRIVAGDESDVDQYFPENGRYARFHTQVRRVNPEIKTLLSVGGAAFSTNANTKYRFSNMVSTPGSRATFISSVINWLRAHTFDGIDLDWEFPGDVANGGRAEDKPNFAALIQEMRAAFTREAQSSGKAALLISIAVSASVSTAANAYDLTQISPYVDWYNLMSYDYTGSWSSKTGAHTALQSSDNYNIEATLRLYAAGGVPYSKLVLGLASFARGWTLFSPLERGMGAAATGASSPQPYTKEPGLAAYFEIQSAIKTDMLISSYDSATKTMYASSSTQWFSYDDPYTVGLKAQFVVDNKLGGIMIWTVDQDNYREKLPLVAAARQRLPLPAPGQPEQPGEKKKTNTALITGVITAGCIVVGLAFLYVVLSRNTHWQEMTAEVPAEQSTEDRYAPVPTLYLKPELRELVKKGETMSRAEAELLDAYFETGDSFLQDPATGSEHDSDYSEDDEDEDEDGDEDGDEDEDYSDDDDNLAAIEEEDNDIAGDSSHVQDGSYDEEDGEEDEAAERSDGEDDDDHHHGASDHDVVLQDNVSLDWDPQILEA